MRETFLSFSPPLIGGEAVSEVVDTLRSDWITTGPKVQQFEEHFKDFVDAPAALAVSSATDAMQVGLAALGIGEGDRVITTPMTFCSTVHVIEHLGARPVLVDVEADTLNIDPAEVERVLEDGGRKAEDGKGRAEGGGRRGENGGGRVRAIMPVHLYGHPCEMDGLLEIAAEHDLAIVEDAAHAPAAKYKGHTVGSLSNVPTCQRSNVLTAFSFYATKNLTTGEGGMLTGAPEVIDEARVWSLHGMSRDAWKRYSAKGSWYYEVVLPGFKCNMTDIQASLGIHQLRKLPGFQARRREIAARYNEAFDELEEIETPTERLEVEHAWHIYAIRLNLERLMIDRGGFIEELKARNIGTSVHFIPVHLHPYYRDKYGYEPEDFPVAYGAYQRLVSLPIYPRMTGRDVEDVVAAVEDVVEEYRR
jgi:dTDP-4-amino-4,6-dideoxygalactose transaminase